MSDTVRLKVRPEVVDFVDRVRTHLSDLDVHVRDELIDGLEADLSELAAEQGGERPLGEVLGDPAVYSDELRAAAGLPPRPTAFGRVPTRLSVALRSAMDGAHQGGDRVLDALPWELGGALRAAQPVWWVARALVAWLLALDMRSAGLSTGWKSLLLLAVLVVGSIQLGRGAWGGAVLRSLATGRLLLVGLNLLAVALVPAYTDYAVARISEANAWRVDDNIVETGITNNGRQVCNVFPYDAKGRPLTGVQLLDDRGEAMAIACSGRNDREQFWTNGRQARTNVFPHGVRTRNDGPVSMPGRPVSRLPQVASPVLSSAVSGASPRGARR